MYFRFGMAVVLVVSVSLAGVALERANLEYRRQISRQHYQLETLRAQQAELRLRTQQLGAPARMVESIRSGRLPVQRSAVQKLSRGKTGSRKTTDPKAARRNVSRRRISVPRRQTGKAARRPSRYPLLRWQRRE